MADFSDLKSSADALLDGARQLGDGGRSPDVAPTAGTAAAASPGAQANTPPALLTRLMYGYYDDQRQWQQSSWLTWEDAGHLITSALSLGRHPYLWDPLLRAWRPILIDPVEAATVIHGALEGAGWNQSQRQALLQGPDALKQQQTASGHAEDIVFMNPRRSGG